MTPLELKQAKDNAMLDGILIALHALKKQTEIIDNAVRALQPKEKIYIEPMSMRGLDGNAYDDLARDFENVSYKPINRMK